MGRLGISGESVEKACQRLMAAGRPLTLENVRFELGGKGSFTSIHKHLKKIKNEIQANTFDSIVHYEMPSAFKERFEKSALQFWHLATSELKSQYEKNQLAIKAALETVESQRDSDNKELLSEVEKLEKRCDEIELQNTALQSELSNERAKMKFLEEQLKEKTKEWKELLEKSSYYQAQVSLLKEQLEKVDSKKK